MIIPVAIASPVKQIILLAQAQAQPKVVVFLVFKIVKSTLNVSLNAPIAQLHIF